MASTPHWRALAIGAAVGAVHLFGALVAYQMPSEGSWRWFPLFLADYPFSVVLAELLPSLTPLLAYGLFGSLWWFFLGYVVTRGVQGVAGLVRAKRGTT